MDTCGPSNCAGLGTEEVSSHDITSQCQENCPIASKTDFSQEELVVLVTRLGNYMNGKSTGVLMQRLYTTRSYNHGSIMSLMERLYTTRSYNHGSIMSLMERLYTTRSYNHGSIMSLMERLYTTRSYNHGSIMSLMKRLHTTRSYNHGSIMSSMERLHHTRICTLTRLFTKDFKGTTCVCGEGGLFPAESADIHGNT